MNSQSVSADKRGTTTIRNIKSCALALGALACWLAVAPSSLAAPLEVSIINERGVEVFLSFGGAATINGQIDSNPLALGTNYSVAANSTRGNIDLTEFSGRVFLALENALTTPDAGNGYSPNFNNPSLGDYGTRWDKAEMTLVPGNPFSVINLTAQDFFSVPMEIRTYTSGSSTPATVLTWTKNEAAVMHSLASLAINEATATNKAIITGTAGVPTSGFGKVVRVISPATVGGANSPYSNIGAYVDAMRTAGQTTKIKGTYFLSGQVFDMVASFATTASGVVQVGDVVIEGTITGVAGVQKIVVPKGFFDAAGVYQANPNPYFVNGVSTVPNNSVFDAAIRDVYVGFNIGTIGSTVTNPNTGTPYKDSTSEQWMSPTVLPFTDFYSHAQPSNPYYNQYAEAVAEAGDAYGFPFTDFVQSPLASLDPATITKMEIVILVPEPSTVFMADMGLISIVLLALRIGRQRKFERPRTGG